MDQATHQGGDDCVLCLGLLLYDKSAFFVKHIGGRGTLNARSDELTAFQRATPGHAAPPYDITSWSRGVYA